MGFDSDNELYASIDGTKYPILFGCTRSVFDGVSATANAAYSMASTKVTNTGFISWLDDAHRTLVNITEPVWAFSVNQG